MATQLPEDVLIIEDTAPMAELYRTFLQRDRISSAIVGTGEEALEVMRKLPAGVLILDLNLPGISGFDVLSTVVNEFPGTSVIVVTSNGSVKTAVTAMQEGAYDFLVKPFNADRLITTVRNALDNSRLREEVDSLREGFGRDRFCGFIGASLPMQAVYRMIEASATSNATVFITGESGTGKEVAAEAIHRLSSRKEKPFVALNCGAISAELAESELFGHRKGSFTGAIADRIGAIQQANGGTLFLDELCEMPHDLQVKLLRVLQSGTYRQVGATKTEYADVRILCATNRNPSEEVRLGRFREDLYYRLHVVPIALPPLRDREDDALAIAQDLLHRFAKEDGKTVKTLTDDASRLICTYAWPGNIRQLQNVLRQATVMNEGPLLKADMLIVPQTTEPSSNTLLDSDTRILDHAADIAAASLRTISHEQSISPSNNPPAPAAWLTDKDIIPLDIVERTAIERAITLCDGNIPRAAALLGVNPSTVYRKKQSWEAVA